MHVGLRRSTETSVADWFVNSGTPPEQLVHFGPEGYAGYARVRFLPDPSAPGLLETDAAVPDDHPLWITQARRALGVLALFPGGSDQCYFCIWEGVAGDFLSRADLDGELVTIPHRRYVLFTGNLRNDFLRDHEVGRRAVPLPALIWPADHSWFFASDVDSHWAGVGADRPAIDRLLADPGLDVVPARPDEQPPAYR